MSLQACFLEDKSKHLILGSFLIHRLFQIACNPMHVGRQAGKLFFANVAETGQHLAIYFFLIFENADTSKLHSQSLELKQSNRGVTNLVITRQRIDEKVAVHAIYSAIDDILSFWVLLRIMPFKCPAGLGNMILHKRSKVLQKCRAHSFTRQIGSVRDLEKCLHKIK